MSLEGIIDCYDEMDRYNIFSDPKPTNQHTQMNSEQSARLSNIILSTFKTNSRPLPMSGKASVSVEKDDEGNTSISGEVNISTEDGNVSVGASASVDEDGNVSGKFEASINWHDEP